MVDPCIYRSDPEFLLVAFAKALGVAVGIDGLVIADHPYLTAVPAQRVSQIIIRTVKMAIVEQQSINPRIVLPTQHRLLNNREILLV